MLRRHYEADWERRKEYLIQTMFADITALSPIPETRESRSVSPDDDVSPLPELITVRVPKRRHDEPDEYYDHLQKRMRKYYRKIFHKPDGDSSGTDFDDNIYDQYNPECTEISYEHLDYDHLDLNLTSLVPDLNLNDNVDRTDESHAVLEIETCSKDLDTARKPTQLLSSISRESIESGKEEEKPRSSSSTVKEQIEHVVVRAMVHQEDIRESNVFPVHNPDLIEKDKFKEPRRIVSKTSKEMDIMETPTVILDVLSLEETMSSTTSLSSQSDRNIEIPVIRTEETERNKNESPRQRTVSPSLGSPNQSLGAIEPGISNQKRMEDENSSWSESFSTEYDITSPDEEFDSESSNKKQGNEDRENIPDEGEREESDQCRETEATGSESLSYNSETKTQDSKKSNATQDNNVEPNNVEIEEEFEEEIEEEEERQETDVCSEETSEVSRKVGGKDSDSVGEELDANDSTETKRATKSLKGFSEETVEIIVTETEKRICDEPMDEIEIMRSHDRSPSLGSLQHDPTETSSSEESNIELRHSLVRDTFESNATTAFEEFSNAADDSDDLHLLLRTSTPTQETRRALKRCSSDPITDDYRKRQRFRDLVTQIARDLKRKRHVEVQTDTADHRNVETQTDDKGDSRDETPQLDEQVIGIDAGCQTERGDEEREGDGGDGGDESDGSESEIQEEDERDGPKRGVYELYLTGENFYLFF